VETGQPSNSASRGTIRKSSSIPSRYFIKTQKTIKLSNKWHSTPPLRWCPNGTKLAYFQGKDWAKERLAVFDFSYPKRQVIVGEAMDSSCDFVWSVDGSNIASVMLSEPGVNGVPPLLEVVGWCIPNGRQGAISKVPEMAIFITATDHPARGIRPGTWCIAVFWRGNSARRGAIPPSESGARSECETMERRNVLRFCREPHRALFLSLFTSTVRVGV
jgi:hypothetical protein